MSAKPKLYNPRHPERTLLYQTVAEHYETGLDLASAGQFDGQGDYRTPKPYVRKAFAALVPPPRTHRHRYFGVLAPNSPLRVAVTAMAAAPALVISVQTQPDAHANATGDGVPGPAQPGHTMTPTTVTPKRAAHYLWAVLIARIYEVFPLVCPLCGGQMRIIAFITHSADIRHILDHIGVDSELPHIAPARGPPLWDDCDTQVDDGMHGEPDWNLAAQSAPAYEVGQRVSWRTNKTAAP